MKRFFVFIVITFLFTTLKAQNAYKMYIDTSNYFRYYKSIPGLVTNWLRQQEIVPIIIEEFESAGIENTLGYTLYRLNSGQDIVLSVFSIKSKVGIAYLTGHYAVAK